MGFSCVEYKKTRILSAFVMCYKYKSVCVVVELKRETYLAIINSHFQWNGGFICAFHTFNAASANWDASTFQAHFITAQWNNGKEILIQIEIVAHNEGYRQQF